MTAEHDPWVEEYTSTADALRDRFATGARLGTLGPVGTTSHAAALHLRSRLAPDAPVSIELFETFDLLLDDFVGARAERPVDLALVPSAYRDATVFHWHAEARLLFHFAHRTPAYGLAGNGGVDGPVVIAAMAEVRNIFDELRPPDLDDAAVDWLPARSTRHAAELVHAGLATHAITNDHSRRDLGLTWVRSRAGTAMVWLVFERTGVAR